MNVCLGIPLLDSVPSEAFSSHLAVAAKTGKKHKLIMPYVMNVFPHAKARELIVNSARAFNADYILFLDDDTIAPDSVFERLLEQMNLRCVDMTVAYIYRRGYPYEPTWFKDHKPVVASATSPPVEIDTCGLACNLINLKKVDERIGKKEWFWRDRDCIWEDVAFSKKLRAAGGTVLGVPNIRCGHVGTRMIINDMTASTYNKWFKTQASALPKGELPDCERFR